MLPRNQQLQSGVPQASAVMPQQPTAPKNPNALQGTNMTQAPAMGGTVAQAPSFGDVSRTTSMTQPPQMQGMTSGGLRGNINPNRYTPPTPQSIHNNPNGQNDDSSIGGGQNGGGSFNYNSSLQGGGQAPQNNSVGGFGEYADSALAQAMRQLNPRMESDSAAFEQQMLNRGIQPGTEMYDKQKTLMQQGHNDLLSQAQYGAQQQGLAAQQQAWGQQYGYDQLANALQQSNIGANASMYGADRGANASMQNAQTSANASMANAQTGANASMYNSELANMLGFAGLNEQGRQFDTNDIFRTNQQDIDAGLAWANHGLGQQGMDINAFNAQNNANNNWWNQIGGMTANAPGVMFNPTGNLAGSMQNAGQNMYNAQSAQNSAYGGLLGGLLGMSDKRLKENIELVDNVDGINVYEFDYIDKKHGKDRYRGVMAQEVKETHPEAVFKVNGYYAVNYDILPVKMEVV